jgi:hypothetical protein
VHVPPAGVTIHLVHQGLGGPGGEMEVGRLMSEPGTEGNTAEQWSPPTGVPAPRPDPYAQFGNPLHDTWGTPPPTSSTGPPQPRLSKARKKRPALRWAVTVAVLVLVAVVGWLARDSISDAWGWVYDRASEMTGDDGSTEPVNTEANKTDPSTSSPGQDAWAEATAAEDRAFDDWMKANQAELNSVVENGEIASRRMMSFAEEASSGGTVDHAEYRAVLVELRDSTLRATQILDTAPQSSIRDDFVTILLLSVNEMNQLITASDERDDAGVQAASMRLQPIANETLRLCRQYGARAKALCE